MAEVSTRPKLAEELELKFTIPAENATLIRESLPLPQGASKTAGSHKRSQRLRSVYYDTPDLELRRRGIGLRVRHIDGRRLQTVKCNSPTPDQVGRWECEHEISSDLPDLTCVEEAGLRDLFAEIGAPERLEPVFATDTKRTAWEFRYRGAVIECAVDVGEIRAGEKVAQVHELELELKDGAPEGLFKAADALNRQVPLRVEWASKGERGYALAAGLTTEPPPRAKLKRTMTAAEAAAAIIGASLRQIAYDAPRVRKQGSIEDVHQMRVAVRKLRAALSFFRPALEGGRLEFEDDLRWLQDKLGFVRDWDVFGKDTVQPIRQQISDVILIQEASERRRNAAYAELCQALDYARFTTLWLSLTRLLSTLTGPTARDHQLDRPIRKFAKQELRRREKKLHKRGRRIEDLDQDELHKLRIGAKKLRYATEFFGELYSGKKVKYLLDAMKSLQDILGRLNDARTARKLLGKLELRQPRGQANAFAHADGIVEGASLESARRERRKLARRWAEYETAEKPWE